MLTNSRSAFAAYLSAAMLWTLAMTLQGFLFTWLLIDSAGASPAEAGTARGIAQFGALAMVLLGGLYSDRLDGRRVLFTAHVAMAVPPTWLAVQASTGGLTLLPVAACGVLLAWLQAASDPARQAALSRVTPVDLQRSVTLTALITSLPGLAAFWIGGRLEVAGLVTLLCTQAVLFLVGAAPLWRLPALLPIAREGRVALRLPEAPLLRDLLMVSGASALFNAGAYAIAIPFLVRELYAGGAADFAAAMIAVSLGALASNLVLLKVLPLRRPGRLYLLAQLSRAIILLLLFTQPAESLFLLLMAAWGANMGVTGNLGRAIVQEQAEPARRSRVLALLLLCFLAGSALGAPLTGGLIGATSAATGVLPGAIVSVLLFAWARWRGSLWQYTSSRQ